VTVRLSGCHVLLTGATGSIGRPLTGELARRGARVTLVARRLAPLVELADEVGGHALPADLSDLRSLPDVVAAAEERHGPVDVLVHNAAMETVGPFASTGPGAVERTVALNLAAPLELTRLVLPGMLARDRGTVVVMSSLSAVATFPGLSLYGATKAALSASMAGLRLELRGTGVQTLTVEIGPVASSMMDRIESDPTSSAAFARARRTGVLRDLEPAEVARSVASAIESGRPRLTLPRRAAPLAVLSHAPRAVVRAALAGVARIPYEGSRS
jgi:short-subunit dehydrogenase